MMVVDASLLTAALTDGGSLGTTARSRLGTTADLRSPDVINAETLSALGSMLRRRQIDVTRYSHAVRGLRDASIRRVPTQRLINRIAELRDNVTAYDAAYVALAESLGCPLITADRRLANALGPTCDFEVI